MKVYVIGLFYFRLIRGMVVAEEQVLKPNTLEETLSLLSNVVK
jgi:hypothetical protein